ncbi:MAG: hypothetical protein HY763_15575 [Planctomycetes bacterium]|nr:hypothetical protein [Planctomycetota bacterium]
MLRVLYLYRNLTRNLLRTGLTCAAVAFPITIYVLSTATVDGIDKFLDNSAKQLRLAVTHKASIINPLPTSYVAKIRALDPERRRIVSVAGLRWIGGKMPDNPTPLSTIALEADTFVPTFPEHQLTQAEIDAWHRDRQAMVVGKGTAAKLGWKVGNRVTMMPSLPPYRPLEFHVISLAEKSTDAITLWCRRDYVYEEFKKAGFDDDIIGFLFVKCASAADMNYVRGAIDELFANAPDATKTQVGGLGQLAGGGDDPGGRAGAVSGGRAGGGADSLRRLHAHAAAELHRSPHHAPRHRPRGLCACPGRLAAHRGRRGVLAFVARAAADGHCRPAEHGVTPRGIWPRPRNGECGIRNAK